MEQVEFKPPFEPNRKPVNRELITHRSQVTYQLAWEQIATDLKSTCEDCPFRAVVG